MMKTKTTGNETQNRGNESCNYKINGEVISFKTREELSRCLACQINRDKKPLTVEPLDRGSYFDHMQEIADRGYEILSIVRGFIAMAYGIQEQGHFENYKPDDITKLAYSAQKITEEIMDIAEASENVYEEQWKLEEERAKASMAATAEEVQS